MRLSLHLIVDLVAVVHAGWLDENANIGHVFGKESSKYEESREEKRKKRRRVLSVSVVDTPAEHQAAGTDAEEALKTRQDSKDAEESTSDPTSGIRFNKEQD